MKWLLKNDTTMDDSDIFVDVAVSMKTTISKDVIEIISLRIRYMQF
jgi:hypothetical protein